MQISTNSNLVVADFQAKINGVTRELVAIGEIDRGYRVLKDLDSNYPTSNYFLMTRVREIKNGEMLTLPKDEVSQVNMDVAELNLLVKVDPSELN